ncbi:hypothetical protein BD410DRAFT_830281 [Rickenella mellea]|uniref:ER membrane protein complex subunit 1 n=1 Tax=Rickenella mellea TaxID=50990 RepID=A0A4Y7PWR7_9AGAM|nr:hypothetical protein BD410DRAFT_830281 [Rickenella mellea]
MQTHAPPSSSTPILVVLVFFVAASLAETVSLRGAVRDRILALSNKPSQVAVENYQFLHPVSPTTGESNDDLELLDICLVASVDGRFHALNRATGQTLWSMQSSLAASTPAGLRPLVRTQHDGYNPDDDGDKEIYIIEPQTGQIFILHGPDEPLHRLPVTMSQLVDLSPFSFTGKENLRRFVGKKETSLLVIELETGRVKATINSECPWDPFGDIDGHQSKAEIYLHDWEGAKSTRNKTVSTEVLIGRTDYHVSIHTRSSVSGKVTVRNISSSRYGANDQDYELQSRYIRTLDNVYIQALPGGEISSFRAGERPLKDVTGSPDWQLLWGNSFQNPIVAVFDVLKSPSRQNPFVLLQPHPRLQNDIYNAELPPSHATFVGLVDGGDSGSLFAMSPEQYPLLTFFPARRGFNPLLVPPGPEDPDHVNFVERMRRERERCLGKTWDLRCLTGKRPVDAGSWTHQLIDGVPSVPTMPATVSLK